ncbi:protein of unknown function [Kyrpidia spormannii]|uniref:Uncharacterized protein n=2 Tax=Kyrpidia spormannii TaxID=2055160 RepID=A0A6F9E1L9_9BACL|nr:protein of unknown function [Kyrpidia spormannii]CAB3391658.1 protein of unknown function [Kyrpidia spormannii]
MFAVLFGYSTVRFRENTQVFRASYVRRLAVLAGIGLAHGLLIWYGDILFHHAILGFVL